MTGLISQVRRFSRSRFRRAFLDNLDLAVNPFIRDTSPLIFPVRMIPGISADVIELMVEKSPGLFRDRIEHNADLFLLTGFGTDQQRVFRIFRGKTGWKISDGYGIRAIWKTIQQHLSET